MMYIKEDVISIYTHIHNTLLDMLCVCIYIYMEIHQHAIMQSMDAMSVTLGKGENTLCF